MEQERGGTGEGVPNDMIVANKDLSLLAKLPDNSEQLDPNFFNNDGNRSSGSNNNANLSPSPDIKSNSFDKGPKDSSFAFEDGFFKEIKTPSPVVLRQLARSSPSVTESVPEKRKKIPDKIEIDKTARALRTQVSFE